MKAIKILLLLICCNSFLIYTQWNIDYQTLSYMWLKHISVADSNVVWGTGSYSCKDSSFVIRRSKFNHWSVFHGGFMHNTLISCIAGLDSLIAFVGTNDGKVYKTSNGGVDWNLILDTGFDGFINDIKFSKISPNVGFIFGDPIGGFNNPFKIFKTTNKGNNWSELNPVFLNYYLGEWLSGGVNDSLHAWLGLSANGITNCKIARTTNGGINWFTTSFNGYSYIRAIAFKEDNLFGLCSPRQPDSVSKIFYTTNYGLNWSLQFNTNNSMGSITSICHVKNTSVWYFCGIDLNPCIYKSTDNGTSWLPMQIELMNGEQLFIIDAVYKNNKIYAFCNTLLGSTIYSLIDSVNSIGIKKISAEVPSEFFLTQNYPNPFNPTTKIRFSIPPYEGQRSGLTGGKGDVKLIIYDVLGKEISVLVNQQLKPGTYEVEWDGSNFASGIYFYKLETSDFTETKRMVLLK